MAPEPGSADLTAPVVVLLLLAAAAVIVGLVPRWRRRMTWGRGVDRYPVSRRGCFAAACALLVMALGLASESLGAAPPPTGLLVLLFGFLLFIVAGLLDRPRR